MRVREPVARPLDIVAVELLLTTSQAFLAGVLLYLAVGFWEDAGVGLAPQAAVLALLGLGVAGAWLFWLVGGVGWPMAAFAAPAGLFLAFVLVMDWSVEAFDVGGAPLLLATASAVFGVIAGVFLDSPRRWRWDQREKLRPGTKVPRVSPATQALVAQVPRSLPKREAEPEEVSELAARIGASVPLPPTSSGTGTDRPGLAGDESAGDVPAAEPRSELADAPEVPGTPLDVPEAPEPVLPTARLGRGLAGTPSDADDGEDDDAIDLPTMIEPKAQRSPWAWAAPPEWNRDEDDEDRSSGGT
ncbi:MAG: hypothetical protein AB1Z67_00345 [Candidatus Limnocylindrales bacterium]